jgi:hypothetical protein
MAGNHQARAQFQTGRTDVVSPESIWNNNPLKSSDVRRLFDTLAYRVSEINDKKLREKALQAIKDMQEWIGGISSPLGGFGLGRNTHQEKFYHDNKEYRIDLELSGEIYPG